MGQRLAALATGALATLLFSSTAHAGDPCPIHIPVVDLGIPDWAKDSLKAKVKKGDPFLARLVVAAKAKDECTSSELLVPKEDLFPTPPYDVTGKEKNVKISFIKGLLVDKKRRFLCGAAARKLKHLKGLEEASGTIVVYRGHSRILLAAPGWASTCISAKKADSMSDKQVRKLFVKLTRKLVKDRHDNP